MGGGPSTMDIWDLKPGAATGGPFKPISTTGDVEICEHMPLMAKQMHNMAIIRSMSTREADHMRGDTTCTQDMFQAKVWFTQVTAPSSLSS